MEYRIYTVGSGLCSCPKHEINTNYPYHVYAVLGSIYLSFNGMRRQFGSGLGPPVRSPVATTPARPARQTERLLQCLRAGTLAPIQMRTQLERRNSTMRNWYPGI